MVNGNETWKVSTAKFQGYMKAKMEDITEQLKGIDVLDKRVDKIETKLGFYAGIAAALGATSGFVASFLKGFFK